MTPSDAENRAPAPAEREPPRTAPSAAAHELRGVLGALSFKHISGIYVLGGLILLFGLWVPETFLTTTTVRDIGSDQAVTAIITLGLLFPLAAGFFDFSVGATVGTSAILCAWLIVNGGFSATEAALVAMGVGLVIGLVNGILIVFFRMDSFIATLGVSSVLTAFIMWRSGDQQIIGLTSGFEKIGTLQPWGIPIPVFYSLAFALVVWYVQEHTPFGRYLYAIGGGREAARLAGIRTNRLIFIALLISALSASFAGIVVTAKVGAGSPDIGPPYLLPVYAAAFLGATQLKNGRVNAWGTIVALYLLATGVKGLQLTGASFWVTDLFNGIALIVAVGLSGYQRRHRMTGRTFRGLFGRATAVGAEGEAKPDA